MWFRRSYEGKLDSQRWSCNAISEVGADASDVCAPMPIREAVAAPRVHSGRAMGTCGALSLLAVDTKVREATSLLVVCWRTMRFMVRENCESFVGDRNGRWDWFGGRSDCLGAA